MEIRQLTTFQKVAELESFSKAGHELGYSQSTVTVQIKALETELGTLLFDRFGKNVKITPDGQLLLKYVENIMNEINSLKNTLGNESARTHTLHIGTLDSLCMFTLTEILKLLRDHHPEYQIKITRGSPSELTEMMEKNEVDIIYILDALYYNVHWKRVIEKKEPCVFVCGPQNPILKKDDIELSELVKEPFFLTEADDNYQFALAQYLAFQNLSIDPVLEVGSTEVISKMIHETGGCSFLPYFAIKEHLESNYLSQIPIKNFHIDMFHQVIYMENKWVTSEMLEFIRIAKATLL